MAEEAEPASSANTQRVPWNPWLGLLFVVSVFVLSQLVAELVVVLYAGAAHTSLNTLENSVAGQFAFVLLAELSVVYFIYLFLRSRHVGFGVIGLKRPRSRDFLYGLAIVPAYYLVYVILVAVVSHFVPGLNVNQQQQVGFDNVHGSLQLTLAFISLVILPPIAEEILVRGVLYSSLKKALPAFWAVIITSGLFAAAHLPEGGSAGPLYIAALDTFTLSLFLIYLREKTGSLWGSITLHAVKNGIAFAALFALHLK